MNVPNINEFDIEIPAGKVALKECRAMTAKDRRVSYTTLDIKRGWNTVTVELKARFAGWNIAGSMMRWDNGAFGVVWEANDGTRHGSWFKTFEDALNKFNKIPETY
jgi:hypothetical protein